MKPRLLSVAEVAERTSLAESTLYTWRTRKDDPGPPSFTLGRRVVYDEAEVDAWIADHRSASTRVAS